MHVNMKIEAVRRIMDGMHERHSRQGEALARMCALLTDLASEHATACGADGDVVALAVEPKEP